MSTSSSTQEAEQDWMAGDEAAAASPRARSSPSSSRYKGVVPQPNGRWGAQIYERHARVWLGTFADEAAGFLGGGKGDTAAKARLFCASSST